MAHLAQYCLPCSNWQWLCGVSEGVLSQPYTYILGLNLGHFVCKADDLTLSHGSSSVDALPLNDIRFLPSFGLRFLLLYWEMIGGDTSLLMLINLLITFDLNVELVHFFLFAGVCVGCLGLPLLLPVS